MALQAAVELPERHELFLGEVAELCERCIENRGGVALAEDEAIAVGVGCVIGVDVHDIAKVQGGDDVCCRKAATGMAAACLVQHLDDIDAHVGRACLDIGGTGGHDESSL